MQTAIVKRITWGAKPRGGRQPYRWQVVVWNVDAYGPTTIAEVATHKSEREANNDRRARSV
jgi:hypothetical protein